MNAFFFKMNKNEAIVFFGVKYKCVSYGFGPSAIKISFYDHIKYQTETVFVRIPSLINNR